MVAGTNIPAGVTKKNMRIGFPADSLNSMVVNAVDFAGNSASYTRIGPVLSFFINRMSVIMVVMERSIQINGGMQRRYGSSIRSGNFICSAMDFT